MKNTSLENKERSTDQPVILVLRSDEIIQQLDSLRLAFHQASYPSLQDHCGDVTKEVVNAFFDKTLENAFHSVREIQRDDDYPGNVFHGFLRQTVKIDYDPHLTSADDTLTDAIAREINVLGELVVNKLFGHHHYEVTQDFHLLRALPSGGLCFVPGAADLTPRM